MIDIDKAIEKMNKLARKGVCIITRVGETPWIKVYKHIWPIIFNEDLSNHLIT